MELPLKSRGCGLGHRRRATFRAKSPRFIDRQSDHFETIEPECVFISRITSLLISYSNSILA